MSAGGHGGHPGRVRVAVVFGGRSTEHAISCVTAGSVLAALDRDRYDVVPVGITSDGRWVIAADDPGRLAIHEDTLPAVDPTSAQLVWSGDTQAAALVVEAGTAPRVLDRVDVVFPLLHGPFGEDGTLQGLLELAGTPYVGSGVLASAVAMDKIAMKVMLAAAGLPVGPYVALRARELDADPVAALARVHEQLTWPVFVKPARAGSSVGISKVAGPQGLAEAVALARTHDPHVLVEQGVDGRELECGVLEGPGRGPAQASVVAEIRVGAGHDFYDFAAKYLDDTTGLDVPADLPEATADRVRATAVAAFDALGCEGLARVDFFLTPDGALVVNEVNTMPGFTPVSMFPRMWAASGVDYPALLDRLIDTALAKPPGLR